MTMRLMQNQNTADLARWLDAKYYESKYRPIPIEEFLVVDNQIFSADQPATFVEPDRQSDPSQVALLSRKPRRQILPSEHAALRNPVANAMVALTMETVRAGYGTLVFCGSRKACELNAALISQAAMAEIGQDSNTYDRRREVLSDLRNTSVGLDSTLERTIVGGVAFHRESNPREWSQRTVLIRP